MYKGLSAALVVVGVLLIIWGVRASQSFGSEVTEALTGSPADRTIWLLVGGIVAALVGVFGLFRGGRTGRGG